MAADRLRESALSTAFSNVVADVVELFQKEMQLAKAEFTQKLSTKVRGGYWMLAAALLLVLAAAVLCQAVVIWIATFGVALHVACLIVGASLLGLAAVAYLAGRGDMRENLSPRRSIHQIKEDIRATKEQLT
jgi:ABC-type polysaccharide/polyol phosphate export permease